MDEELELVNLSMEIFTMMRRQSGNEALAAYLKILPDPMLRGSALHIVRKYLSGRPANERRSEKEKRILAAQICQQIFNESIQKARKKEHDAISENIDGAELFYRRALNHMARDRYSDAERLLKRAVDICPDFTDGFAALADVLEHNGKIEEAKQARLRAAKIDR